MKTNIIVNLQIEGIHAWPECPFKEVSFLRNPHRHIFHICCKKEVKHDDRQIEIIMLKRKILKYLNNFNGNLSYKSCEMIARNLSKEFNLNYCSVLEDGENGAEIFKNS